ncbi:hypothetical protein GCM10011374_36500 [Kocuria dechangensis]|uniref:Uncharacterized protein n=1 Tax=Kocuria dechangensis TaxID=1176249 RepID=A0A917H652_9MICC|nr:hypothetical protein [Kocuria dechangensis]GGG68796.1 hypothetical protein GCM10011374_36500 [Kocuria dechangensis]
MDKPSPTPEPEPHAHPERHPIPGDNTEESKLAAKRPHVERLKVVRTGARAATVYIGWPDSPGNPPTATTIYEQARAYAHATGREDHLLETSPMRVAVHLHTTAPELPGPSVEVLMDLSRLPKAGIETHFYGLEPTDETLDWFLDAVVAASWALAEGAST